MNIGSTTLKKGSDPLYSHTLSEFVEAGSNSSRPTYDYWSYIASNNNIQFTLKNIINSYLYELKSLSTNVYLSDKELKKYNYNPKLLSADVYGTTEFHYLIMMINGICNIKEFVNINPIKMIRLTDLTSYLTSISVAEKTYIDQYNSGKK